MTWPVFSISVSAVTSASRFSGAKNCCDTFPWNYAEECFLTFQYWYSTIVLSSCFSYILHQVRLSVFTCRPEPPSTSVCSVFTGSGTATACLLTLASEGFTVCPNSNGPVLLIKGSCGDPNLFSSSDILPLWLNQHDLVRNSLFSLRSCIYVPRFLGGQPLKTTVNMAALQSGS